jgi:hypothetical protein
MLTDDCRTSHVPLVQPADLADDDVRMEYCATYAFAVPTEEALAAIAAVSPAGVVEIGAGSGYWAALLRDRGVLVEAYDIAPEPPPAGGMRAGGGVPDRGYNQYTRTSWGGVQPGPATSAARHPGLTLLLCWPPEHDSTARQALESYRGDTLVYVGELNNDRDFADEEFFALLRSGWEMTAEVAIPQWRVPEATYEDSMTIWRRQPPQAAAGA